MIRHICMFKLKNREDLPAVRDRAESLRSIPQIRAFRLVENDPRTPESNYDFSLILDFDSVDALNAYSVCPTHVAFGSFLTPLRELRACFDYEF